MVEETGAVMSDNLTSTTQISTDLEVTNTSDEQFENQIHLDGYSKEPSNKLSSSYTSSSSRRQTSNDETNISRDSLSYSVLSQVAKRPLDDTPRTSTPAPLTSVSPRHGKQNVSGVYRQDIEREEATRKQLYDPESSKDVKSKHFLNQENRHRPMLQFQTTGGSYRLESYKEDWYFDILRRMEDLSWSYQKLETEYAFLERFMDEQKEDLKKVKNCSKHLRNRADLNAPKGVH